MPLKRHPALQDYSREHHDELMLVWKIREGLKKNVSSERIQKFIVHHYNETTKFHMANEEKFILGKLPSNDVDRKKILSDHAEIKQMVDRFSVQPNSTDDLKLFSDKLENHIRFEERNFFPRLQNEFSESQLLSMNPHSKNVECSVWTDNFWEK